MLCVEALRSLVVEREFDVWLALRVECCVCGFGFVWGEVVALEVVDERGEICLCFVLKLFDRWLLNESLTFGWL